MAGSAIAATSQQEKPSRLQGAFTAVIPSVLPATKRSLPHLKPSSTCPQVPLASSFNSQQFDQQLQRYLRFITRFGRPDILIVGSSRALQGIEPIVLQQTLANQGYPNLKIFNLGVNGATAQLVDLLLHKILSPDQLPRLLLWGDGVRAFNSGRVDITYNRAIASQSYQLLSAGIRPALPPLEDSQVALCAVRSLKRFDFEATGKPKYFDVVPSFTLALHSQDTEPLKPFLIPEPLAELQKQASAELQETTGFQPMSDQFQPARYFRHYPRVQGKYDADYRDFNLEGQQTAAFTNIIRLAQIHQIPVVFVNLPLTQGYLDATRAASERQFRAYLQRFARSHTLRVYDLSQRWLTQTTYFTDPSHLNRYGAAAVAAELGRSLILPQTWLQGQH